MFDKLSSDSDSIDQLLQEAKQLAYNYLEEIDRQPVNIKAKRFDLQNLPAEGMGTLEPSCSFFL